MTHDPFLDPLEDRPKAPTSFVTDPLLNIPSTIIACVMLVGINMMVPVIKTGLRVQRLFA